MRKPFRFTSLVFIALSVAAQAPDSATRNSDTAAFHRIVAGLDDAWNKHDMHTWANFYAQDADFTNVRGCWWRGRAEIERQHAATHATVYGNSSIKSEVVGIRYLAPDIAVLKILHVLTPDKATPVTRQNLMTMVMKKQPAGWAIVVAQNTTIGVMPPPPNNWKDPCNPAAEIEKNKRRP